MISGQPKVYRPFMKPHLDFLICERRTRSEQKGQSAGYDGGCHRGAAFYRVEGRVGAGRSDSSPCGKIRAPAADNIAAGRNDIGLEDAGSGRAASGVAGGSAVRGFYDSLIVKGADSDNFTAGAGNGDASAVRSVISCRRDDDESGIPGSVHGVQEISLFSGMGILPGTHRDVQNTDAERVFIPDYPVNSPEHVGNVALALVIKNLDADQTAHRSDSHKTARACVSVPSDNTRDMCSVSAVVIRLLLRVNCIIKGSDPAAPFHKIRMGADSGIQDCDTDTGAEEMPVMGPFHADNLTGSFHIDECLSKSRYSVNVFSRAGCRSEKLRNRRGAVTAVLCQRKNGAETEDEMSESQMPGIGEFYRDKAGGLYQITAVAVNAIDKERMVVYQELQGRFQVYVLPAGLFLSGFQRVQPGEESFGESPGALQPQRNERYERDAGQIQDVPAKTGGPAGTARIHAGLMEFLDAGSYREKLEILQGMRDKISDRVLDDIGMSLDLAVDDKPTEEKYLVIRNYLKTQIRFEDRRLR